MSLRYLGGFSCLFIYMGTSIADLHLAGGRINICKRVYKMRQVAPRNVRDIVRRGTIDIL